MESDVKASEAHIADHELVGELLEMIKRHTEQMIDLGTATDDLERRIGIAFDAVRQELEDLRSNR